MDRHLSFVIYFHPNRLDNLYQMLRLLNMQDSIQGAEFVLVCQTEMARVDSPFSRTTLLNMRLADYRKPLMCNVGVRQAAGPVIAIVDSDRITPPQYFSKVAESVLPRQAITIRQLLQLKKPYSDEQILRGQYEFIPDHRSVTNEMGKKNLFAGNTVMFRQDYLRLGGMDESFFGYGYADNDMTQKVVVSGLQPVFLEGQELHLYHPREVCLQNELRTEEEWRAITTLNALRYCRKWGVRPSATIRRFCEFIAANPDKFGDEYIQSFCGLYGKLHL